MRRAIVAVTLIAVLAVPSARAEEKSAPRAPDLRLTHLLDGLALEAPDDDPARIAETETFETAKKRGVDLANPPHPMVAHRWADGRMYYVFYKVTENAFGDRPYVIQRIKKIERTWPAADAKPQEKVTYQVEVFKTFAGTLKGADQHFGDFGLRDAHRREIVKEYEIGFGEAPGACEGKSWPFADTLFKLLQPYGEEIGLYDKVVFTAARKWTLSVGFAENGTYFLRSPELGIDAPKSLPDESAATPKPDSASKNIVLTPGVGPKGVDIGKSTTDDLRKVLGEPIETAAAGKGHTNVSFRGSITCNIDPMGKLNSVITRAGFAGKTSNGIAHGQTRAKVMAILKAPAGQRADALTWRYDGLQVTFDGFDRVARLVVSRK